MLILSNRLLVLLSASTLKSEAFTARELVEDTLQTFPMWFKYPEIQHRLLRSVVASFVKNDIIIQIGQTEAPVREVGQKGGSPRSHIYCFTDKGRKQRNEASTQLMKVLEMVEKIVESDLKDSVQKLHPKKRVA